MESEKTKLLEAGKDPVTEIFNDEPQDAEERPEVTPEINLEHFENVSFEDIETAQKKEDPDPDEEEEAETVDAEELPPEEEKPGEPTLKEKLESAKKQIFKSLLKPETMVLLVDMFLSRIGTFLKGTERADWEMDSNEKEVLQVLFEGTIEEENIEMMPTKYWVILALVVIYVFKGVDNWELHKQHKFNAEQTDDEKKSEGEDRLKALKAQVEYARVERELLDELSELKTPTNGKPPPEQKQGYHYNDDGTEVIVNGKHMKKSGHGAPKVDIEEAEEIA